MGQLKALYMFVEPGTDPTKHRAVIDTPAAQMFIVGVGSIEEGAKTAKALVDEGVVLIELCGGFGYEGAKRVHDEVGEDVPVGMIVHQVWNAGKLAKVLGM